jgi:hypothetical protein
MPSLTNYGQQVALYDDNRTFLAGLTGATPALVGGIAQIAAGLELFADTGSVLDKDASVLNLPSPGGGGYTGVIALTKGGNWSNPSASSGDTQIVLTPNQTFTATANPINDIGGAYIEDGDDNVLAWWERSSPITLATNDTITADQLTIRIV